jgi:hypothetical protein
MPVTIAFDAFAGAASIHLPWWRATRQPHVARPHSSLFGGDWFPIGEIGRARAPHRGGLPKASRHFPV